MKTTAIKIEYLGACAYVEADNGIVPLGDFESAIIRVAEQVGRPVDETYRHITCYDNAGNRLSIDHYPNRVHIH